MDTMAYKDLKDHLEKMTDEQLDKSVTIFLPWEMGEFYPVERIEFTSFDNDVLDIETPILVVYEAV